MDGEPWGMSKPSLPFVFLTNAGGGVSGISANGSEGRIANPYQQQKEENFVFLQRAHLPLAVHIFT